MPPRSSPKSQKLPSLKEGNKARDLLKARLESGEITGQESPLELHESEPLWNQYPLQQFRTCYYNLRRDLGILGMFLNEEVMFIISQFDTFC